MEKFFIITEKSSLYSEYTAYKKNVLDIDKIVMEFCNENGIKATIYATQYQDFYIAPADDDIKNFGKVLCEPVDEGLRRFKSNSKIAKAWVKRLHDKETEVLNRPDVQKCFNYARGRYRLFDKNDTLYCSCNADEVTTPEGFIEIKGSDFHKALESRDKLYD